MKGKKLLITLGIAMSAGIFSASAQIYVKIRPPHPVIVRTEAPSPRHVWINEDWRERDGKYEYNGGRWAEPPREGYRYTQGHWDHSRQGHTWHEGGWNEGRGHEDHGHGEHH